MERFLKVVGATRVRNPYKKCVRIPYTVFDRFRFSDFSFRNSVDGIRTKLWTESVHNFCTESVHILCTDAVHGWPECERINRPLQTHSETPQLDRF